MGIDHEGVDISDSRIVLRSLQDEATQNEGQPWEILGNRTMDWRNGIDRTYDQEFFPLLESLKVKSIFEWIQNRVSQSKPVNFLDIMGTAENGFSKACTTRTAVSLIDPEVTDGIHVIHGDIFLPDTQNRIRFQSKKVNGYDLVVSRGLGADKHYVPNIDMSPERGIDGFLNVYQLIANRIYSLMSNRDSLLLCTLPRPQFDRFVRGPGPLNYYSSKFHEWIDKQRINQIDILLDNSPIDNANILMMQKHANSPDSLV